MSKRQIWRPVAASSAYMRPVTPNTSPPALPMNTMPFQAIGAAGTVSPRFGSAICTSHSVRPVRASMAKTCPSSEPRNSLPSRYAAPRFTFR
jgi:hypothetical protein